jgi:DtxR family Mn-dependent transcriptional regulator
MRDATVEDYLGTIFQIQKSKPPIAADQPVPVPLSELREQFGFTHISIHEMIQKLVGQGWVEYTPYQGVRLTCAGETRARDLLTRHQTWERFLVHQLGIPVDEAHEISHHLEHAAPQIVTERLDAFLKSRCGE